ncbi:DUF7432 family protein [Amycolatopsis sp. NPDC004368]
MSEMQPRPESFEDLPDHERQPITIARISIDETGAPKGVLAAADSLFAALRAAYGADLTIQTHAGDITANRPRAGAEQQKALEEAQDSWDRRNREFVAADERARLQVGDTYSPGYVGATCENVYHLPCSLPYTHQGKHIKVVDDIVTAISER